MLDIKDKAKCCGCTACVSVCPKNCIEMRRDTEGFLYPHINKELCINCNLCVQVCQYETVFEGKRKPIRSFGYVCTDQEERRQSSSGAFFYSLSKWVINQGGIVFGTKFDKNWHAIVDKADSLEDIKAFRGSKYVQSEVGNSFKEVKKALISGRLVLFSGTPCQVSGLNHFLRKEYHNLITVDFTCHAVPSPLVWQRYLQHLSKGMKEICYVNFRNKELNGWRNYSLQIDALDNNGNKRTLVAQGNKQNLYMKGFLQYLYCRPSCNNCPARGFNTHSDIMIGDFWHVEHYHTEDILNDNKGVSLVMSLTSKGDDIVNELIGQGFSLEVSDKEIELDKTHSCIVKSERAHRCRGLFFALLNVNLTFAIKFSLNLYRWVKYIYNKFK